jgi:membrane associated rhomboid family serine protease
MIPISTDSPIRRTPLANYTLIALNALVFMVTVSHDGPGLRDGVTPFLLHADEPAVSQFLTYQFLHGDSWHLVGNMIFLWVFGNPVNAAFGHAAYVLFYLAGGVTAGLGFALVSTHPLLGASGAVAAVTTSYLVLFPRNHVKFIYFFFFIGFFELPSLLIITAKIIVWDNLVMPSMSGPDNVAYSAHLVGYAFGLTATLLLLLLRALPRDHFDLLALIKRWHQRHTFAEAMRDPSAQAAAKYGRVARPVTLADAQRATPTDAQTDQITAVRTRISDCIADGDLAGAAERYQELLAVDDQQVLPRRQQLDVCNQLYADAGAMQAAAGYEKFLRHYSHAPEASEVRLLLGIIYARDLEQYEAAERHLQDVGGRLTDDRRIEQHRQWLDVVLTHLGRTSPEA